MVNIVNAGTLGGGFRAYSGLVPVQMGSGNAAAQASVKIFHSPAANAVAIFRGDIVVMASAAIGTQGAADLPGNISAPSASVVVGNGGGSGLGNQSMAPNIMRWTPGDTTSVIAGVVVGFGPITLYMAKNGFQYIPASIEAWVSVETDPRVEMLRNGAHRSEHRVQSQPELGRGRAGKRRAAVRHLRHLRRFAQSGVCHHFNPAASRSEQRRGNR
jgi:hypothetical protein